MVQVSQPSAYQRPVIPTPHVIPSPQATQLTFGRDTPVASAARLDAAELHCSPEFVALRRLHRRFVFPASALFMTLFMSYVLLSAYAHDLMATPVLGLINLGILLGLGQFASTVLIMVCYLRYAANTLDPAVAAVHARARGTRS